MSIRRSRSISSVDEPRQIASGPALSNSFGFGGMNTALVLSRAGGLMDGP